MGVGRPSLGGSAKRNVVTVRLTDEQAAQFDAERGRNSRSAYLRAIVISLQSQNRRSSNGEPAEDPATADRG